MSQLVKMSPKGQLVVPKSIRELSGFEPSDRFVPIQIKDGVLFKKLDVNSLVQDIQKQFKDFKVTKKDIQEAIGWVRKSS